MKTPHFFSGQAQALVNPQKAVFAHKYPQDFLGPRCSAGQQGKFRIRGTHTFGDPELGQKLIN